MRDTKNAALTEATPKDVLALAEQDEELKLMLEEDLKDSMDGVQPRLLAIKIMRETPKFQFPDEQIKDSFTGIIVDSHPANAYWSDKTERKPTCWSYDGKVPSPDVPEPKSSLCGSCPLNRFGSDPDGGKGKACKNMRRLVILLEGESFPMRLTLPPSSLKAYDEYVTKLLYRHLPVNAVVTRFELERVMTDSGYEVSRIKLSVVRVLNKEEFMEIRKLKELAVQRRSEEIVREEEYDDLEKEETPDALAEDDIPF